jgi:hypothetical protein
MALVDGIAPLCAEFLILLNQVPDPLLKAIEERPHLINLARCISAGQMMPLERRFERKHGPPSAATIRKVTAAGVRVNLDCIEEFFNVDVDGEQDVIEALLRHCVLSDPPETVSFSDDVFEWVCRTRRSAGRQLLSLYLDAGASLLDSAPPSSSRPEELWISRGLSILRQPHSSYYVDTLLDVLESKWQPDDPRWLQVRALL